MAALLLLTLLTLSATILSLAENITIGCGALRSYVDSDKNITLVKDSIPTGISNTIECFRYGNLSCYYSIPAIRRGKSLVRTSFHTENYDGKSSPPSFYVVYDLKYLDIVVPVSKDDKNGPVFISETIYSPASEKISVCLVPTSLSGDPSIFSIEVYGLDDGMYDDLGPDEGLILGKRFAYGAKDNISYPEDPYGRRWLPKKPDDQKVSELKIDITGASNKPPKIVMSKAFSAQHLELALSFLPKTGLPVYLALYFSEPKSLGRNQRRSFKVFLDETQLGSGPIVPVFGKATQVVERDILATSESKVVFESTSDSDLPPIINAMELYSISTTSEGELGKLRGSGRRKPKIPKIKELAEFQSAFDEAKKRAAIQALAKENGVPLTAAAAAAPNRKLPLILGVSFASAFAALSSVCGVIFCKRRQNAEAQSKTEPTTSTGSGADKGISPLVGQKMASDVNPTGPNEPGGKA